MNQLPFEAIIFDHDGTLVDTETADFLACQKLCEEYGQPLSMEEWATYVVGRQDGYAVLFERLIERHNLPATKTDLLKRLSQLWPTTLTDVSLSPGVMELLPRLQTAGYRLGVATAADHRWVNRWLTHFDIRHYFQVIATRNDVLHNKPAPDVYLFAASQLQVKPGRCVVFEDSQAGLQAAHAAGMVTVAVPTFVTQTLDFSLADAIIESLEQVTLDWLAELSANRS